METWTVEELADLVMFRDRWHAEHAERVASIVQPADAVDEAAAVATAASAELDRSELASKLTALEPYGIKLLKDGQPVRLPPHGQVVRLAEPDGQQWDLWRMDDHPERHVVMHPQVPRNLALLQEAGIFFDACMIGDEVLLPGEQPPVGPARGIATGFLQALRCVGKVLRIVGAGAGMLLKALDTLDFLGDPILIGLIHDGEGRYIAVRILAWKTPHQRGG